VTAAANQQLAVTEAPDVPGVERFEGVAVALVENAISWRPLAEPQPWREAALRFASINSVMALGGQNAGKSTLCRYLANASTQKVALLDLDCGQPLSGPPGFVSLRVLDGPFLAETSHENNFERRIYLGATTPSDAPDAYVAAAVGGIPRHVPLPFLRSFPRNRLQSVPTPSGWTARGPTYPNSARHGPRASDDARNYRPIADGLERAIGLATR